MIRTEKSTILLVDDDEGHAELVRRHFRRVGISNEIVSISRGDDALNFVFRRGRHAARPEGALIVLLDINMPGGVDGVEVLRQIKADPTRKKVPVFMLTTTDDPREVDRCYELGCGGYLKKPIDPNQFVESVTRLGHFISVVRLPGEEGRTP